MIILTSHQSNKRFPAAMVSTRRVKYKNGKSSNQCVKYKNDKFSSLQEVFRFLDLPPELRNRNYSYSFKTAKAGKRIRGRKKGIGHKASKKDRDVRSMEENEWIMTKGQSHKV